MLTAAAQLGASSLQHLSAGEYKYSIRVAFTSCIVDVSYFAFTNPQTNILEEAGHQSTTDQTWLNIHWMLCGQHCTQGKATEEARTSLKQPASLYP